MRLVACVACVLLVCRAAGEDKPQGGDEKAFQGTWEVVEHLPGAKAQPPVVYYKVVVAGTKLTLHSKLGDKTHATECEFKLDPTTAPKQLDLISPRWGTYPGLYEFKDGKLRLCYRGPGSTRPKDFDDAAAGNQVTTFLVLKLQPKT
jgi:uncharacterized protein (TIGR03067 family)